jgi:hypothetical protein
MSPRRAVACLVLLALVLAPVMGVAGDELSGAGGHHHRAAGLRHQAPRPWRSVPAAVASPLTVPCVVQAMRLEPAEPEHDLPLFVRPPFVPPRA